jgi:ribonuclease J
MRARIHRGAREICGSCVEIEHDGRRLVLDIGRPLTGDPDAQVPLPTIDGLAGGDPSLVGVVISHPHPDHYGLVAGVHPSVPIYIGEAAGRILAEASFFTLAEVQLQPARFLRDRATFELGPFSVTPYLMDHSAFDSYTLLVEAGGKRLLYSGDVRGHGRKRALFERFLTDPPDRVDGLLLEGTHVRGAETDEQEIPSEAALEERWKEHFARTRGMVLACYSPQNVDRVVTLFRAAKRCGRLLVLDLYGATITHATGRTDTIPQADWANVRVFVPLAQRLRIKRTGAFQRIARVGPHRIYPEQLGAQAQPVGHDLSAVDGSRARTSALPLRRDRVVVDVVWISRPTGRHGATPMAGSAADSAHHRPQLGSRRGHGPATPRHRRRSAECDSDPHGRTRSLPRVVRERRVAAGWRLVACMSPAEEGIRQGALALSASTIGSSDG